MKVGMGHFVPQILAHMPAPMSVDFQTRVGLHKECPAIRKIWMFFAHELPEAVRILEKIHVNRLIRRSVRKLLTQVVATRTQLVQQSVPRRNLEVAVNNKLVPDNRVSIWCVKLLVGPRPGTPCTKKQGCKARQFDGSIDWIQ